MFAILLKMEAYSVFCDVICGFEKFLKKFEKKACIF